MKGIVVYDTSYGNTKKIAETIAETLKESGMEADLFSVKKGKEVKRKGLQFPGSRFSNQMGHNELCNQILFGQGEK